MAGTASESSEKKPRKKIDTKAAAKGYYCEGKTFKKALMDAGASEAQASKGKQLLVERDNLRKAFMKEHAHQLKKLEFAGSFLSAEQQQAVVRGGLIDIGLDKKLPAPARVRSFELLGKDKRVNMFTPDNAVNLYSLQVPSDWEDRYITTPTLDAIEVKDAVALEDLPTTPDGFITLNSFNPHQLKQGIVELPELPKTLPTTQELPLTLDGSATEGGSDNE